MTIPAPFGVTAADFARRSQGGDDAKAVSKSVLGKDDFLSILVAQMKNQDPLSPLDGAEFATQLAQFSNVEQLINIGKQLDAQAAAAAQNQLTSQTLLGASLIGREVSYQGDRFVVGEGEKSELQFSLPADAVTASLEVVGADGNVVYQESLTNLSQGEHRVTLDADILEPGSYRFRVTATGESGKTVPATLYAKATVDGVSFDGGQIMLRIKGQKVPLLEINSILAVPLSHSNTEPVKP